MKKRFLKISLLSASLLVASGPAINANIPGIAGAFPDIPLSTVELLSTIPSLFLMMSVLTSSFIARKIGYKKTIMVGIGLVMICGFIPAIVNDFYLIVVSRALLGFGIGLFNSLLVVLVNCLYEGKEKSSLFGIQAAFEGIGGMMITFIAGQLINLNWQAPFYSYLIAIPVFFMFLIFVPNVNHEDVMNQEADKINEVVSWKSYLPLLKYIGAIFIVAVFYMSMGIKTPKLMIDSGYGTASDSSIAFMLVGFGSMMSGLTFGKIYGVLKKYTLVLALTILSGSLFIVGVSSHVFITYIGGLLIGFGFRLFLPYLINSVNFSTLPNKGLSTSFILVSYNLGVAITPYACLLLQKLPLLDDLHYLFYFESIVIFVFASMAMIRTFVKR